MAGDAVRPSFAAHADALRLAEKRHGVPAIFSFFLPGLGQLAKGDWVSALFFFGVNAIGCLLCLVAIGFVMLPIMWLWNLYDAYTAPDGQTKRELKRLANLAVILACALAIGGCGSVTGEAPPDGGTGGAGGVAATGGSTAATGGAGMAGAPGSGGTIAGSGGASGGSPGTGGCGDTSSDPNNCGACGRVCPPAERAQPNDSQQLCYKGGCFIPSGDVCTSSAECITTDCAAQRLGGGPSQCQPKPCSANSDCPGVMPNCDDPLTNWARCQPSNYPDGGIANPCICSVN